MSGLESVLKENDENDSKISIKNYLSKIEQLRQMNDLEFVLKENDESKNENEITSFSFFTE